MATNVKFIGLLFIIILTSCKMEKEKKYRWIATVSAPQEYPSEVYWGDLIADDYHSSFSEIFGTSYTGWGSEGKSMGEGIQVDIPHTLEFTYLSLVEKKFYTGKWQLDIAKITALFDEGFMDYQINKRATFDSFIIGLAPKGRVALWVGAAGVRKEVGFFQAHDTIITQKMAYENAQYMLNEGYPERTLQRAFGIEPAVKEKIAKYGRPDPNVYSDLYRERYSWKPVVLLPDGGVWKSSTIHLLNGEFETLQGNELLKNDFQSRAIPFCFVSSWKNKTTDSYGVRTDPFDEQEIINAFKKLGNKENIELIFKVASNNESCRIFVKNKIEEIELKKAIITCKKLKS